MHRHVIDAARQSSFFHRATTWLVVLAGIVLLGCADDAGSAVADAGGDAGADAPTGDDGGDDLETIALETGALSLRVTVSPFGFVLRSSAGDLVLETLDEALDAPADPSVDAYGPPAATRVPLSWRDPLNWGWDAFDGEPEPWTRFSETRSAELAGGVLTVVLGRPGDEPGAPPELTVTLEVDESELTVTMALDQGDGGGAALNRLGQSFRLAFDEHLYGLGGRPATVDHRGQSYSCVVEESGVGRGESEAPGPANPEPNGLGMTAVPIPFLLSSSGYGLWLETDQRCAFHLGSHRDDAWRLETAGEVLRYHVYVSRDPLRSLELFTEQTGRPPVPPEWALGPRRRIDPDARFDGLPEWEALRQRGVPTTVLEETTEALPRDELSDAAASVSARARAVSWWGYRLIGSASPYVAAENPATASAWADAAARGVLIRDADGEPYRLTLFDEEPDVVSLLDPTHAEGDDWLLARLQPGLDYGYAGWRLDHGEHVPLDAVFADGREGWEVRNAYPRLIQSIVADQLEADRPGDHLLVARSGWVGSAGEGAAIWLAPTNASFEAADGLPSVVRATLNLGLSGVPLVGADIGGNQTLRDPPPDRELYLRWAAVAAFSPAMHDDVAQGTEGGGRWSLWSDVATTDAYTELARVHTRMAPYRRGLALEASRTGAPLVRHLMLHHPDDPEALAVDDQYYLGPALLVAPILVRESFSREAYFPEGRFVDWDTGDVVVGPTRQTVEASFEGIPVFLADGGIVPMYDASIETLAAEENPDVVGPTDVAEWLDVRALRSTGASTFEMADGTVLTLELTGPVRPPFVAGETELPVVFTVEEARDCDGCYLLRDDNEPARLWLTTPLGENVEVLGQGLRLSAANPVSRPRRVRWDVIILPDIQGPESER